MFVYSAVHICLNISIAAFWLFALLALTISPCFYSNLFPSAFSTGWVLDAEKTSGTSLGLFMHLAFVNPW